MPSFLWQIVVVLLLIGLNGLLAMAEIAVVSARKARLQVLADKGDRLAAEAITLADAPNQFLSTVQVGITLVGVLSGAFGGATLANQMSRLLPFPPWLAPYRGVLSLALVVSTISYLTLIWGELVPKRLGLNRPEALARVVARPMRRLAKLASPLVHFLSFSTEFTLRLLRAEKNTEPSVTEEEIRGLIRQGTETGLLEAEEERLMERVLRLDDSPVNSIMTPRTQIVWLDQDDDPTDNQAKVVQNGYSRYLVCRGELDNIVGVVHVKDLLRQALEERQIAVSRTAKEIMFVPETMRLLEVLERFRQAKESLAVVINEYGSIEGLVTLTDILEAIVGDIPALAAGERPKLQTRPDGSWLVDGLLPVETLKDLMGTGLLPGEEEGDYRTAAGLLIYLLGRIPREGDRIAWEDWRFEVLDMDGHRIDKVLITREEEFDDNTP